MWSANTIPNWRKQYNVLIISKYTIIIIIIIMCVIGLATVFVYVYDI